MTQRGVASDSSPHIIVIGNEKGGSGKTTVAMHVAVALLKAGQRVATIDLDSHQRTLSHYIEHRAAWADRVGMRLEQPEHVCIARGDAVRVDDNERGELADFARAIAATEGRADFVVIDTPPHDTYLMRLAHLIADTLITPLNDSFLDLDVLASVDPVSLGVIGSSHYADMVGDARRRRRAADGKSPDWVVMRNRLTVLSSRHKRCIGADLAQLSRWLSFRVLDGLSERLVYRQLFPRGLTALDYAPEWKQLPDLNISVGGACREVAALKRALHLPMNERGEGRAAARAAWLNARENSLVPDDVLAPAESAVR